MKVVFVGSGNVSTVFAGRLESHGHEIIQVFNRKLGDSLARDADVYVLAVDDTAIYALAETLRLGPSLVVHTSGATPMDVLARVSPRYGVLYPLQSLRKEVGYPESIPLLIDGSAPEVRALIGRLAADIGGPVVRADDGERLRLHVAAVFAGNFTNHLFAIVDEYCRAERLDFTLLLPIIRETVRRLDAFRPKDLQTGPAARGDQVTIDRHRSLLQDHPEFLEWYDRFTRAITRSAG